MSDFLTALTVVTALGCGLNAGFFFAFSAGVTAALRRLPPAQGMAAMQSINVTVINPAFMTVLFGTALLCIAVTVGGVVELGESFGPYLVGAGAVYLVATIGLTMTYHVPRNNRLAGLDPATDEGTSYWARYLAEWTSWNHARTLGSLAAAALLTVALTVG
jgi:uncharacterized membrane protein